LRQRAKERPNFAAAGVSEIESNTLPSPGTNEESRNFYANR
jgi:hypothetical protein